jgi:hypothetical protein
MFGKPQSEPSVWPTKVNQGAAAGIGQSRAHALGLAIPAGQTGQSEAIHSPEGWANIVVRFTMPVGWSMAVLWMAANDPGRAVAYRRCQHE